MLGLLDAGSLGLPHLLPQCQLHSEDLQWRRGEEGTILRKRVVADACTTNVNRILDYINLGTEPMMRDLYSHTDGYVKSHVFFGNRACT